MRLEQRISAIIDGISDADRIDEDRQIGIPHLQLAPYSAEPIGIKTRKIEVR